MKLSVILCCYNSVPRLEPTLQALSDQKTSLSWELIVIDNNSTDDTAEVADRLWNVSGSSVPLRIVKEKTPGLSAARKKGIHEAKGELILFCDDDNHLAPNYVHQAIEIMEEDLQIGALCGYNKALIEGEIPEIVQQNLTAYACGHDGMESRYLEGRTVPWGAGLVVRTAFMKRIFELNFHSLLSDRTGKELSSGGDTEYCYLLRLCGYRWKYDTRLSLKHAIPSDRLNIDYLQRLYRGFGQANVVVDCYYKRGEKRSIAKELKWWKVYLLQRLYFLKNPIRTTGEQAILDRAFRKGYLEKLRKDRNIFRSRQEEVRHIIAKLPHVS
ncbi:MAG: glycosyltransferase family 2 protein [Bacteroidetes bacterium]|nr:MAG: glycosyltransferase family 2 protein [Bacteroidota bacterium]